MSVPGVLERDELSALLDAVDGRTRWHAGRNRLVVLLMSRCGLRVGEACGVEVDHVSITGDAVWLKLQNVKRTVGRGTSRRARFRNVPCPDDVAGAIREWVRGDLPAGSCWLLPTRKGTRYDRHEAWRMVERACFAAGIDPGRVWPHKLRHTAATEMLEDGLSLPEVQLVLGHASLQTTSVYQHVRPEVLKAKMKARVRG